MSFLRFPTLALTLGLLLVGASQAETPSQSGNWPRFRGPAGTGHSEETDLPIRWDEKSIAWRTPLSGVGQSSPIVWEDRIFLTSALDEGRKRAIFAVDRNNGKILWETVYETGDPGPTHDMNRHASSTGVTDGERVIAFFGKGGLHCVDRDGKRIWSRQDLGEFLSIWGTAASPILFEDLVIVCCDQDVVLDRDQPAGSDSKSYLLAVDKRTGQTVWTTPRYGSRGWSTPVAAELPAGGTELIVNGPGGIFAYDPQTGEVRWQCDRAELFGEPMVAFHEDLLFAVSGRPGPLYAVRRGGRGNVTSSHLVWQRERRSRDLSSPIIENGLLFTAAMNGVGNCYDPKTGKELWKERLEGDITASPVAANGHLYFVNRSGETVVIRPSQKLEIIARNSLPTEEGEDFLASPALSSGQIFVRSDRALYAIGARR